MERSAGVMEGSSAMEAKQKGNDSVQRWKLPLMLPCRPAAQGWE